MYAITDIERQLKKRLRKPYQWGRFQNNEYDQLTNFVYEIFDFEELLHFIDFSFGNRVDFEDFYHYALNRWFNFWSAQAVEQIFQSSELVTPSLNPRNRLEDFKIQGISFDHKTSVFPEKYPQSLEDSIQNPKDLMQWLYQNQSRQGRMHLKNRLFIVLYAKDKAHWKLKAEIQWLKELVEKYMADFDAKKLTAFQFEKGQTTFSDIIWGIK